MSAPSVAATASAAAQSASIGMPPEAGASGRIASVDALRGLVILLMIFVNDAAGIARAPGWVKHLSAGADGMTLADLVFPAFLFIAGVSIPLALGRARAAGVSRGRLAGRVLGRTVALLIMGVVMVNMETHNPWWRGAWGVLAYVGMMLAFAVGPREPGRARTAWRAWRWGGGGLLLALALLYRDADGHRLVFGPLFDSADTVWLRHSWWGILGLIGWAYLVASLLWLVLGARREWLVGATGCLMLLFVAAHADLPAQLASRSWLDWAAPPLAALATALAWIDRHVSFATTLGAHAAITMAGCCLGSILARDSDVRTPAERVRWALTFAAGLFLAGVLLDAPYGINKIRATPAWCFYCAAITTVVWVGLYWMMDLRGVRAWGRWVQPAGENPLLAYVLHPFLAFYLAQLFALPLGFYRADSVPVALAIAGSLLMAFLVVQLAGWIARTGYRLKV